MWHFIFVGRNIVDTLKYNYIYAIVYIFTIFREAKEALGKFESKRGGFVNVLENLQRARQVGGGPSFFFFFFFLLLLFLWWEEGILSVGSELF